MEKHTFRDTLAETFGGSEVQRGTKLGTLAGLLALVILFGSGALQHQSSTTVNLDSGQIVPLIFIFIVGLLALFLGMVLAFYSGLSAPEARSGDAGRAGLLSGAITMLLFWVGQTIYGVVAAAQSPGGVQLDSFVKTAILRGIAFFVFGGLFGWWGARAAARRSRSILSPPTSITLSALDAAASSTTSSATAKWSSSATQPEAVPPTEAPEMIAYAELPEDQARQEP
jgi:vacuolar-type H+-ATPase subunit I/STV1